MKEKKHNQKGISYVEIIVVIGIIAILSVVAVPVISNVAPHYRLKGASQELVSALREAQNLATTTQNIHIIHFNEDFKTYSLIRKVGENETTIKTTTLPNNVSFTIINLSGNKVSFTSSGAPENTGTVVLLNSKAETITIEITNSGQIKSY